MNARERLALKPLAYATKPCCAVPLTQENPDCVWHGYRSLMVELSQFSLSEEVCAHALTVETRAQAHALRFFRDGALKDAARQALTTSVTAEELIAQLLVAANQLIATLEA